MRCDRRPGRDQCAAASRRVPSNEQRQWERGEHTPFGNDHALDLVDELAELDEREKEEHLRQLFGEVLAPPAGGRLWPKEVVAGAALVALALPGGAAVVTDEAGGHDKEEDVEDNWGTAVPSAPSAELLSLAVEALQVVTVPAGQWCAGWRLNEDRAAALGHVTTIATVLRVAMATGPGGG
ncbi:DUF4259 domain-containing protein [Micromonospora psammae]|uniref:DUF4259 domain-containing protein n=1 Tax=Micromonospora sp. CPCC 205556 TaxID=3122398 RepID=UPI002FF23A4C